VAAVGVATMIANMRAGATVIPSMQRYGLANVRVTLGEFTHAGASTTCISGERDGEGGRAMVVSL
jgi:hypothetical protein